MKKLLHNSVRVMADWNTSGIWAHCSEGITRHYMLEWEELDLPESLAEQFDQWISHLHLKGDWIQGITMDEFAEEGRRLAVELKRFLGPEIEVLYAPETNLQEDESITLP